MKATIVYGLLLAVCFAGGCKKAAPDGSSREKIILGIVAKSQTNAVFQAAHAGARDAGKEFSEKLNKDVVIDIKTPTDEDPQAQAEAIGALVREGAKGIAVSCTDGATLKQPIDDAVAKGVVVVCFDSDSKGSKRMCYYGTDDTACGTQVMVELAKAMKDQGTVAILAGNQSAPNLQARLAAVREELKKHPNMKELNDGKGVFYHEEKPEKAAETVASAQNANPQIQGWAMVGGWPLFATDALPWKGDAVKCVSVDALTPELAYLKTGQVEVLLAQDCYGWGHKSVELLLDRIVNNKSPESDRIIDPLTRVTKENADEWAQKWTKWLGK
jgi:ribose transport system substrate-binding protein